MARYGMTCGAERLLGGGFPFGTFFVNLLGCALMGALAGLGTQHTQFPPELRTFLMAGVLGGFTTFSAFSMDFVSLWQRGLLPEALLYAAASVIFSLLLTVVGLLGARAWTGTL
jgi:CrcB protein